MLLSNDPLLVGFDCKHDQKMQPVALEKSTLEFLSESKHFCTFWFFFVPNSNTENIGVEWRVAGRKSSIQTLMEEKQPIVLEKSKLKFWRKFSLYAIRTINFRILAKIFQGLSKLHSTCPDDCFVEDCFLNFFKVVFDFEPKSFGLFAKIFRQGSENWNLRVRRNSWTKFLSKIFNFFKFCWTSSENV